MIASDIALHRNDTLDQLLSISRFVRKIPTNTPVFFNFKCFCTDTQIKLYVIPLFFSNGFFQCRILAIDKPELVKGCSGLDMREDIIWINVKGIISYDLSRKNNFLNFGVGYMSPLLLTMTFTSVPHKEEMVL